MIAKYAMIWINPETFGYLIIRLTTDNLIHGKLTVAQNEHCKEYFFFLTYSSYCGVALNDECDRTLNACSECSRNEPGVIYILRLLFANGQYNGSEDNRHVIFYFIHSHGTTACYQCALRMQISKACGKARGA